MHENNQVYKIFLTKTKTSACIFSNPNCETKNSRTRTQHMKNKNPTRYYCMEKTKTKQGYDKEMYPKLVLNKLKVMGNSDSIYIYSAFNSRMFHKKILTYMWPMFTHVHPCVSMCKL